MRETRLAQALIAHPHRTAAGLLGALVLAYLWPVLLGGRLLAPTGLLMAGVPWSPNAPAGLSAYVNQELGDVPLTYYAWAIIARDLIHSGTFPAWNPHAFGGTPLWANLELAWLSPFSLPMWLLPLDWGIGLAAALKLWAAGFGTYLLGRELRLGFWASMVAAVSFALCAFNVVWLTYGVFVSAAAALPWGLWLTERVVRRGRASDGLALAGVAFVVVTAGHPGTSLHVLAGIVLYACVRAVAIRDRARAERLRALLLVGAAFVVGAALAAVVLVPAQRAAAGTLGELLRRDGAPNLVETRVPFSSLRSVLLPEWSGRPSEGFYPDGFFFRETTFYAGVVPLMLAALALVSPGAWRRKAPFALLDLLGLAIPLRAPLLYPLAIHLPLFDQVQNQRLMLWFLFAVALLAAFGAEALVAAPRRRRVSALVAAAALAGLVAAATQFDGASFPAAARYVLNRTTRATPQTLALASIGWLAIFLLGFAGVLALQRRRPQRAALAGALLVLLVAFDLLHFAHGYNPMGPASVVKPPVTPGIAYLQRHADDGRIAGVANTLPPDWSAVYGLRDVRGDDPPQPSLDIARLWFVADAGWEPTFLRGLSPAIAKLIGLYGGRYVMWDPRLEAPLPEMRVAYRGPDATIFENELALPRAFVARSVEAVGGELTELALVASAAFDPRWQTVVRTDELAGVDPPETGSGAARVVEEANASVTLTATLRRRSLVVLDDQYMPGWTVTVDGRPATALHTDIVLRGVIVPAGRHRIRWSYRVPGLRAGAALSGLGLLAVVGWGGALLLRRRRRSPRPAG